MKILRNILLKFLFLAVLLFCLEPEVYNDSYSQSYSVEISADSGNLNDIFSPDNDSFDDDHIYQAQAINLVAEPVLRMSAAKYIFLLHQFPHSNWQPPQYS